MYVSLINSTDKGVAAFKDTLDRAEAEKQLAGKFGGALKETYWTIGPYDIVAVSEVSGRRERDGALLAGQRSADEMRVIIAKAS